MIDQGMTDVENSLDGIGMLSDSKPVMRLGQLY
jgi:hypothetical protein